MNYRPFAIVDGKLCAYSTQPEHFVLMLKFNYGSVIAYRHNKYNHRLLISYLGDEIERYPCKAFYEKWYPSQLGVFSDADGHAKALEFFNDVMLIESALDHIRGMSF